MTMILRRTSMFILVTLVSFIFESGVNAQDKWAIGLSAQMLNTRLVDLNILNITTKGAYRPTSTLFTEYSFGKRYAIHMGIGYSLMTQNSDLFKNDFHYLAVPLYVKTGKIQDNKRIAFTFLVGTNLHYLLKAEHIFLDDSKIDIKEHCQKYHIDGAFGSGIKFRLSERTTLEGFMTFSLGSYVNKPSPAEFNMNNLTSGFMFNLSYKLK
ncbi:hypothetical protein ACFLU5_00165 [Bacteroidota bacterium]